MGHHYQFYRNMIVAKYKQLYDNKLDNVDEM